MSDIQAVVILLIVLAVLVIFFRPGQSKPKVRAKPPENHHRTWREPLDFDWNSLREYSNWVVVDAKTTGWESGAQVVEIAVVSCEGKLLLSEMIMPTVPISKEASDMHEITKRKLKGKPQWPAVHKAFIEATHGKDIVMFNAVENANALFNTIGAFHITQISERVACARLKFAKEYRQPSDYHADGFMRLRLKRACYRENIPLDDVRSCSGDAEAVRLLALRISDGIKSGYNKRRPKTPMVG